MRCALRSKFGVNRLDVRYLKTLVAVAEHGTFTAAANAVGLSPSAVSMQIRTLEIYLAAELFDRSHRPLVLNERGMALMPMAHRIINLHDSLRDAAAAPGDFAGRLRLGVIPTALSSFVPAVLSSLNRRYPQIEVDIVTGMNTPLFKLMKNEELDAGIIGEPPRLPSGLFWRPFTREEICVIAPPGTTYASAGELLASQPYVKLVRGALQLRMIEEQLARLNVAPRTIMQLDSIEAVTLMVHHGLGISIVPQRKVDRLLTLPVERIPFGDPPLFRTLGLIHIQGSPKSHLADALFRELLTVCDDSGDGSGEDAASRPS